MSVIHPAGAVPVALMLAVTVVSVIAVSMLATLMDPREKGSELTGIVLVQRV